MLTQLAGQRLVVMQNLSSREDLPVGQAGAPNTPPEGWNFGASVTYGRRGVLAGHAARVGVSLA